MFPLPFLQTLPILLAFVLLLPAVASCCEDVPVVELVKHQDGGRLGVAFVVKSSCSTAVSYQQSVDKSDGSGRSSVMQQDELKLESGVPVETSVVYFPNAQSARVIATIRLFRQQKLVVERAFEFVLN